MFLFLRLATVCTSNIKSSFLPWSICHFLKGMIWKEALKKLLRGIDVFSEAYIWGSDDTLISNKVGMLTHDNRLLSRSRETKVGKFDESSDVVEQHRLQSLQKALVVQWLCFTPPSTITNVKDVSAKLLFRALIHR